MQDTLKTVKLLKGLTYSIPTIGAVRIGHIVERNGKRLPTKDDEFTICEQFKERDGSWALHPLDTALRKTHGIQVGDDIKLRRLPVRLVSADPGLSMDEAYVAFNGRETPMGPPVGAPLCIGDGETAKRRVGASIKDEQCPGSLYCAYGKEARCDAFARVTFRIEGQDDDFGVFILRTGAINTVRTLRARMQYYAARFGQGLPAVPLFLELKGKSSSLSHGSVFWYLDLRLACSEQEAFAAAKAHVEFAQANNLDLGNIDALLRSLRDNGTFAETPEDAAQFEDLLAARFVDDSGDAPRAITVKARPAAAQVSASALIGDIISQITQITAEEAPAQQSVE